MKVDIIFGDEYFDTYQPVSEHEVIEVNTLDELVDVLRKNATHISNEESDYDLTWARIRYGLNHDGREMLQLIISKSFKDDFLLEDVAREWMEKKGIVVPE